MKLQVVKDIPMVTLQLMLRAMRFCQLPAWAI
jgi:hypothetical protein